MHTPSFFSDEYKSSERSMQAQLDAIGPGCQVLRMTIADNQLRAYYEQIVLGGMEEDPRRVEYWVEEIASAKKLLEAYAFVPRALPPPMPKASAPEKGEED